MSPQTAPQAGELARPPQPEGLIGLRGLWAMLRQRSPLAALELFHRELGDVFQFSNLPHFNPYLLVGPEANRFVFITARDKLRWRAEQDPITRLLRQGLLVIDGEQHDHLRQIMTPAFHRRMLAGYVETMWQYTDQISHTWPENVTIDMLDQIRRMALLILIGTMFRTDFSPELERLWPAVVRSLRYISPGLWLIWPSIPRPGYAGYLAQIDDYLYSLIRTRRTAGEEQNEDLLGLLVNSPELSDDLIRDQLYTMLIAGHDTSTALLAWAMYLLGRYDEVLARARAEVDTVLGQDIPTLDDLNRLTYLEQVINETMRLYPPLHLGVRFAETDLEFKGYHIPAGSRLLYSPYLTHRHPDYWPEPARFNPDNFSAEQSSQRPAFAFVPFGGGPRICLGAAFAQVEAKVILARILQTFDLRLIGPKVHLHMGVTLEPRPGVMMQVQRRTGRRESRW